MIEAIDIKKTFDDKEILKGISGTFFPGKVNMIIGASGTGKSVFLKSLVGLIEPDTGQVLYDKQDFINADRNLKKDIRRKIGMLFQGAALFDSKSVEENLKFPLDMLSHIPEEEKLDRINLILKRVGLEGSNKKMPSELSGGMQKRVGIARAIVNNSKYLFCDEPNSGLDPQTAIMIDELIREITKEYNITTVVVTHDMNSVMNIGEHIIFVSKGEKLWEGTNKEIIHTECKELQDFIFSNNLMKTLKQTL